jgi:hypothetical protein
MDINMDHYTRGYETGQCKYTEKSIESGENTENGPRNIELWDAYNEDGKLAGCDLVRGGKDSGRVKAFSGKSICYAQGRLHSFNAERFW